MADGNNSLTIVNATASPDTVEKGENSAIRCYVQNDANEDSIVDVKISLWGRSDGKGHVIKTYSGYTFPALSTQSLTIPTLISFPAQHYDIKCTLYTQGTTEIIAEETFSDKLTVTEPEEPPTPTELSIVDATAMPDTIEQDKETAIRCFVENASDEDGVADVKVSLWGRSDGKGHVIKTYSSYTFPPLSTISLTIPKFIPYPPQHYDVKCTLYTPGTTEIIAEETFNDILTVTEPAPPPPPEEGTITFKSNVTGAALEIDGTTHDAKFPFTLTLPVGLYNVKATRDGLKDIETSFAIIANQDEETNLFFYEESVQLAWPAMPAELSGKPDAIEWWGRLQAAYTSDNKTLFKRILIEGLDIHLSPIVVTVAVLVTIAKIVIAWLGSVVFAKFLYEEALQTIDMGIWTAQSNGQWDLAQRGVDKKEEILTPSIWDTVRDWLPFVNIIAAVLDFVSASRAKLAIDKELIDRQTPSYSPPETGDIEGWVNAYDNDLPTDSYLPTPELPAWATQEGRAHEDLIESWYWTTRNNIDAGLKAEAQTALNTFTSKVSDYRNWYNTNLTLLQTSKVDTMILSKIESEEGKIPAFQTEIDVMEEEPPENGTLVVTADVTAANVYIDGNFRGKTPLTIQLAPGTYHVLVNLSGYESDETDVTIVSDETTTFNAVISEEPPPPPPPPPPPGKAYIDISTVPSGANIFIDEVNTYEHSPALIEVEPGTHTLKLTLSGYDPATGTYTIAEGETQTVAYTFVTAGEVPEEKKIIELEPEYAEYTAWKYTITARNKVTNEIIRAKIIIDDFDTGSRTTGFIYLAPSSTYRLRLEAYGFIPYETIITTAALPA